MFQEGSEPMTCFYMCGMHMPVVRLIRHLHTEICDRNTQMRLRRRYLEIAEKCVGETLSPTGYDGAKYFEGVDSFKYLGRVLHRMDEDWPAVSRNIGRTRQVLGSLGKLLRREGADLIVSENLYRAVVQAVLLFGSETWVLMETMLKTGGGTRGFLASVSRDVGSKYGGRNV